MQFAFHLVIFTGAFLLFQVQPLMAKYVLPWFGGSPAVWTICMLFFQVLLLGGYAYAHGLATWLKPRTQVIVHLALLTLAVAMLPITPAESWKPSGSENPTLRILLLLLACLGLPYLVLSATGPLMQSWFYKTNPGKSPYRLYALSNLGSLLALLSYPFVFEPWLSRKVQAVTWSWGMAAFALFCAVCAWIVWRHAAGTPAAEAVETAADADAPAPTWGVKALWVALPMAASALLLAITNKLSIDVAVVPFLWIAPLALYLLTFIICFDSPGLYSRRIFQWAYFASAALICELLYETVSITLTLQVVFYCVAMFLCCMLCHAELYRLKPANRHLTSFYLHMSAGGAAGGLFVGLGAPILFTTYAELGWALCACGILLAILQARDRQRFQLGTLNLQAQMITLSCVLVLGFLLVNYYGQEKQESIYASRNFYGTLRVHEINKDTKWHAINMRSGSTLHGHQFADVNRVAIPTTYYNERSGIGLVFKHLRPKEPRRYGVVGLGAGTLAIYGKEGDYCRFYEINPTVEMLANKIFKYLILSGAKVDVVLGDGRLSLEREAPQQFDILALDAFSSDAIPIHLLTQEAFAAYLRHLKPDGVLAVHISNRHLDLAPVVFRLAAECKLATAFIRSYGEMPIGGTSSEWVLLSRDGKLFESPDFKYQRTELQTPPSKWPLWTDEKTSLLPVIK